MKIGAMGNAAIQPANNNSNSSQVVDTESKKIQAQITNAQNKLQQISSNQNMSEEEKSRLRQEIQKQISELNNQLRKHQLEVRQQQQQAADTRTTGQDTAGTDEPRPAEDAERTQDTRQADDAKRAQDERRMQEARRAQEARRTLDAQKAQDAKRAQERAQAQETRRADDAGQTQDVRQTPDTRQADSSADRPLEDIDAGSTSNISAAEMKAVVSANTAVKHASAQGQVSASISNKARVIEGEIRQDSRSDRNIKSKEAELEALEKKAASTSSAQMSILADASGEVRRVNVRDNVGNKMPADTYKPRAAEQSAKVATGFLSDGAAGKGRVGAYSKGKMFSSVEFSF